LYAGKEVTTVDRYTACLLGWFFGMEPKDVVKKDWTQEEIDKAQAYCERKHVDPIYYWEGEW